MIPLNDTQPEASRVDDDDREFFDLDPIDDDADFDGFDVETDDGDRPASNQVCVPLWRLIEIARENRDLKWSMADFADYDDFEDLDGGFAGEFSS